MRPITVLLLTVMVTVGFTSPSVASQTTLTKVVTSYTYSVQTVGTTTANVIVTSTWLDTTDTLAGGRGQSGGASCWYDYFPINNNAANRTVAIRGTIGPVNHKIYFFIMNSAQFEMFSVFGGLGCGPNQKFSALLEVDGLTSAYSLDWKNPPPVTTSSSYYSNYYFVFFDPIIGESFTVPVKIFIISNQNETYVVQNTLSNPITLTTTITSATPSLQMPQVPQTTSQPNNTAQLTLGIVAIAAVLIGAVFLYSRRKPKVTQEEVHVTRSPTKTAEGKMFCIECGNELPPHLKFCDSCGTRQL